MLLGTLKFDDNGKPYIKPPEQTNREFVSPALPPFSGNDKGYSVMTLVVCEEWEAIYIDGDLVFQDHAISPFQIQESADGRPVKINYIGRRHEIEDYVETHAGFPQKLSQLPIRPGWLH